MNYKLILMRYARDKYGFENVLKETDGKRAVAAKLLGLSRSSLYRKLESLGISRHEDGDERPGVPHDA